MIDILYPFKMDNLSEAYSSMYEALNPKLQAIQDKAQADVKKRAEAKQATEKKTAAFQDFKKQQTEKGAKPHEVLDRWKGSNNTIGPLKKEGRYRAEWEQLKLMERDDYRQAFDTWIENLSEEGYDLDRWSDEELVETFITESDLWGSRDAVLEALLSEVEELDEEDKKGKGSGTKDACYHKVKSRYSVWPSAYASGALVKCRKKGAKNWGNSSKKEEVEYNIDEGVGKEITKQLVRGGIKVGGKTGGKVVKAVIKHGGRELKNQAIQTAGEVATNTAKKIGEKAREKAGVPKEVQNEAVATPVKKKPGTGEKIGKFVGSTAGGKLGSKAGSAAGAALGGVGAPVGAVGGYLAGSAAGEHVGGKIGKAIDKKLKKESLEDFNYVEEIYKGKHGQSEKDYQDSRSDAGKMISGDSKTSGAAYSSRAIKNTGPNPAGGSEKPKAQGRMGAKDREYLQYRKANLKSHFSNWRDELNLIDENRMTAYNAGAGEGMEDRGISKSLADKMGRSNDESAFSRRKTSGKFNKDYNKNVLKDKKPRSNTTGRGTPPQYRKDYEDRDMGRYQSKIVQGKGSIKDLGKKK